MKDIKTPPNGGWGWMVVAGAALINLVNQSMFANYGLIFGEHLKQMANGSATGITIVMAVSTMVTNFSGLLVGPMLKEFSIRSVTLFGIACTGGGMIISSFSSEIWHIIVGYGCCTGLGLGIIASGTFLAINDYFTTKKSTAVGMAMAGTGVGQMIMPTLIGMLLKKYDFSGTTFILGVLSFSGVIGAMFFKPIFCCTNCSGDHEELALKTKAKPTIDENCNGKKSKENGFRRDEEEGLLDKKSIIPEKKKTKGMIKSATESNFNETALQVASSQHLEEVNGEPTSCIKKFANAIGLSLLKDLTFVHIIVGLSLCYVSSITFSTFLPMFLQDDRNYSVMETTYCMTALSFADVVGRVTVSEICRKLKLGNRSSFMLGCILLAMARSCLVELSDLKSLLAVSFVVGYFRSITVINQNLVISEYMPKEMLPPAVGLNMVSKAIFIMTLGQTLGLLTDQFSYGLCIHMLNVILLIVVATWILENLVKKLLR